MSYDEYKMDIPEGEVGEWSVSRFVVDEEDASIGQIQAMFSGHGRYVPAGTYTWLRRNGEVVMSDTPNEIRDHLSFIHQAHGRVLIHGLGLGMCVEACLRKDTVEHVTVVENSPEVIELVGSHLKEKHGDRLEIIEGDAFTWPIPKGTRWDVAWHDIWDDLCTDNLEEMTRLHRRFGSRVGWQGSWGRDFLRDIRRRERRSVRGWG